MSDTKVVAHDLSFDLFITEEQIQQRVKEIGAQLTLTYQDKCPLFITILNGAFVFAADLVRACEMQSEITFVKLASYDGTESSGAVHTVFDLQKDIKDRHVIIAEDIIDTGTTMQHFVNKLQQSAPASITVVSLLTKPDALKYDVKIDYIGFEIANKFVIGYGLDYDGLGRHLRGIYQLAEKV